MNFKKILLFFIITVMIIFTSCSNGNNANSGRESENSKAADVDENLLENETTILKDNLPDNIDYEGYDFTIYLRDTEINYIDFFIETEEGDILNDIVYQRNKKTEERFNINFKYGFFPYDDWSNTTLSNIIMAGDDAFDFAAVHGTAVSRFATSHLTLDWYKNMPYVDLDAPWWPAGIIENLASFKSLYGATGDISYTYLNYAGCLLFNKGLFKNLDIEYPYNDVVNGNWTLDNFISVVKKGMLDLDGDGVMNPDYDMYGLGVGNSYHYPINVFYCAGDRVISIRSDGLPELTMYNERTVEIYDKFFEMMDSGAVHISDLSIPWQGFQHERALMYNASLTDILKNRALEFDIGILPMPKYDESTPKYYLPVNQNTSMIIVPVTAQNTDRTSIIVEALAAEGYNSVIPAYFELNLKTKQARDDESAAMLDYIRDGVLCDYGVFDTNVIGGLNNFGSSLVETNTSFTVMYERNKTAVEANIEKLKEEYGF
jgi:ABC-type sugar transport system, periplasmic component